MHELLQQLANGVVLASVYLLLSLGLSLVFGVLEITHFAHGSVAILGGYFAYTFMTQLGFPVWSAFALAVLLSIAVGILLDRLPYWKANERSPLHVFIIALGLMTFLDNTMQLFYGPNQVEMPLNDNLVKIGPIILTDLRVTMILTAVVCTAITVVVLRRTKLGTAVRAVAENREAAILMGINIRWISAFVFGFASAMGAVVGIIYGTLYALTPYQGDNLVFYGFAALVLAGMGNVMGTVIASLILGIFQSFSLAYISSLYAPALVFGLIVVILIFKPIGLFGKAVRR